METHLKFNAVYISKDGKLLAMNKPEQSDFQSDVYGGFTKEAYNEALQSSISAAVEFHPNDTVAEDYVIHERGKSSHPIPILLKDCIGRTYPVPDGHSISIEEFWWVDSQEHWRKVSDERESDRPRLPKKTMFALLVRVEEKEELNDVPEVNIKPVYRPVYRSERRLRVIEDLHPDKIIIPVEGKEEPKEEKMPIELPDLPQEDKDRIMKQALETASYCLLFAMKVTKSENFINGKLNNNGTEYELSFKRLPLPSPPSNP